MTNLIEAFRLKYPFSCIKEVTLDTEEDVIKVVTNDAKIWVDLPELFQGYYVKMLYRR
jgi:hypothetical protein